MGCCAKRNPPPPPQISNLGPKSQPHDHDNNQEGVSSFVVKTLLMKLCQFTILTGYFFFILQLSSAFNGVSLFWIIVPSCCYIFVTIFVRIKKKSPPHFAVLLIMHIVISFCLSFIIGVFFTRFKYDVISLPLSLLFVYVAYLILVPLFFTQRLLMDMSIRKYYLIPLSIILIENIILLAVMSSVPPYTMNVKMRAIGIYVVPTMILSSALTWLSMLQLRQIVRRKWFHVVYDSFDYLYAALYLV